MPRTAVPRAFTPTTLISVLRPPVDPDRDGYDPIPPAVTVLEHQPASISPTGRRLRPAEQRDGGSRQTTPAQLITDLIGLTHTDLILDETTGLVWTVGPVVEDRRLGLNYLVAEVERVDGVV